MGFTVVSQEQFCVNGYEDDTMNVAMKSSG
jgi:hypothetical protein